MTDKAASSAPDAASADQPPALVWLRRDLRLADNPALDDALRRGGPVVAVWILDPQTEALGAAHRWRLEASRKARGVRSNSEGASLMETGAGAGAGMDDLDELDELDDAHRLPHTAAQLTRG